MELPRGHKLAIKGNVVSVTVYIQPIVDILHGPFDENVTDAVKLKMSFQFPEKNSLWTCPFCFALVNET